METPLGEWAWDTATHAQLPPNSQLQSALSEWVGSVNVCVFESGFVSALGWVQSPLGLPCGRVSHWVLAPGWFFHHHHRRGECEWNEVNRK